MNLKTKALRNRVVNKTSDVLSFPKRAWYGSKAQKFNREASIVKQARGYDKTPNMDERGNPTEAAKYRTASDAIKFKYRKGVK